MTASLFARALASAAMAEVFADRSLVASMLAFRGGVGDEFHGAVSSFLASLPPR